MTRVNLFFPLHPQNLGMAKSKPQELGMKEPRKKKKGRMGNSYTLVIGHEPLDLIPAS